MALPAAVIFDFDGIILDSETPEFESHRRIFELCGVELTVDEWCHQIGTWSEGLGARWHRVLCERSSRPLDHETFEREQRHLFQQLVPREPMRGIRDLLGALAEAGIPRAVASSGPARWVAPGIERLGLTPLFGAIVTGDDVVHRKPAPDSYLEAARRLGADPTRAIAIEDSGPGIPEGHLDRVFQRFFTYRPGDARREHVGLGLAIAKQIVESYGGGISASNRPGGGARFEVRLPRLAPNFRLKAETTSLQF